jgi:hypothetical protein
MRTEAIVPQTARARNPARGRLATDTKSPKDPEPYGDLRTASSWRVVHVFR